MREAVVVDMARTAFGRAGARGVFREISQVEMMVPLFKAIIERNKLDPNLIDEVHIGSVGLGQPLRLEGAPLRGDVGARARTRPCPERAHAPPAPARVLPLRGVGCRWVTTG